MTFIRVPADSVGKQVETNVPNTDHRQVVTVGDSAAVNTMAVASTGQANVLAQPTDGVHPLSTLFDADTGVGTEWLQGVVLRKRASGGSVEAGTSTDPLRIDPTGTTVQPVSGTVTTTPPSNASTNVAQISGTTADTNSGLKSAGTLRVVLATDQPALTNKLLVTPDSVALPANQSVNVAQLAGTTTDTNSGTKTAGTLRVVLATDQPALTNKLLVTPDANSTVAATLSAETTKVIGTVRLLGNSGAITDGATAAAVPANALLEGLRGSTTNPTAVTDGQMVAARADKLGRLNVATHQVRDLISHQTTQIVSSSAETTIVTAGAAGVFNDIISIILTNETATATTVTFKDSTAGTTRMIVALAASGGAVICPSAPIPQLAAAANNWTATLSVATVTVDIFIHYAKNI